MGTDDHTSQKHIVALTLGFKSFRCFYLAESYVSMKKWPEAIGLLDRALEHVTRCLEQYRSLEQGSSSGAVRVDKEKVGCRLKRGILSPRRMHTVVMSQLLVSQQCH